MYCHSRHHARGVALIQSLILSAAILILALTISATVHSHLHRVQQWKDFASAAAQAADAEAALSYALLTQPRWQSQIRLPGLAHSTTFYGVPTALGPDTQLRLWNMAGFLAIQSVTPQTLSRLYAAHGLDAYAGQVAAAEILDWQDQDSLKRPGSSEFSRFGGPAPNRPLLLMAELGALRSAGRQRALLAQVFTAFAANTFDPLLASNTLLRFRYPKVAADLIRLRHRGRLSGTLFSSMTGEFEDIGLSFKPSNRFRYQISARVGHSRIIKTVDVEVSPYVKSGRPIAIYATRWYPWKEAPH